MHWPIPCSTALKSRSSAMLIKVTNGVLQLIQQKHTLRYGPGSVRPNVQRPRLRRGSTAVSEVCDDDEVSGCFQPETEVCGPWLTCLTRGTIAVKTRHERPLLHETAHAIYRHWTWHPYWGSGYSGSDDATRGHTLPFRCLLLDVYYYYTDDVSDDAYEMLNTVCEATGS